MRRFEPQCVRTTRHWVSHRTSGSFLSSRLGESKTFNVWCSTARPVLAAFVPFQAVAVAVQNAHTLRELEFGLQGEIFLRDPTGLIALANALREHPSLQEFNWYDFCSYVQLEAVQIATFDPVLQALQRCTHLQPVDSMAKYASCDAMKNLLQLQSATELNLVLETEQWLAVADEIRQGRCNIRVLHLSLLEGTVSDATEAVQKIANAIRFDRNLERLTLKMQNGFTDAAGVALAEALSSTQLCAECACSTASCLITISPIKQHWVPSPTRHLVPCCASIPVSICSFLCSTLLLVMKGTLSMSTRCSLSSN
jgi:hypothetical protein